MDLLMMSEKQLRARVEAFKLAAASERLTLRQSGDCKLDVRIAERDGDPVKVAEAKAARERATAAWYKEYTELKAATKALCEALGISEADLKRAL